MEFEVGANIQFKTPCHTTEGTGDQRSKGTHSGSHSNRPSWKQNTPRALQSLSLFWANRASLSDALCLLWAGHHPRESWSQGPVGVICSQNQASCVVGACFTCSPSCDGHFYLTRCRERTQDWKSANLASCLSPAPCVTLYKSFKWSASI